MRFVSWIRSFVGLQVIAACVVVAEPAAAQDPASLFEQALRGPLTETAVAQRSLFPVSPEPTRPESLVPLYSSLAVLQALDVHSTRRSLASGGREVNPVMQPVVKNRAAFMGAKAAATAGVIFVSERLWKKKHRKAAVVLAVLTNAGLAAVVANNYRAGR